MRLLLNIFFLFTFFTAYSQNLPKQYRIDFTDKKGTTYSINNPGSFLSEKAIARRAKYNISLTESDLPVSELYCDSIVSCGAIIFSKSKWFNSVTIGIENDSIIEKIKKISFVKEITFLAPKRSIKVSTRPKVINITNFDTNVFDSTSLENFYGATFDETIYVNGQYLHQKGFFGKEIVIAVLDAGFLNTDSIVYFTDIFDSERIIDTYDFVKDNKGVYESGNHGTTVFSVIGSFYPGKIIGSAPQASYILLRTEDKDTEYLIEEENWIAGAERADSMGADIITSSLGYSIFTDTSQNHRIKDLDGKTIRVSIAADIAFSKGIIVVGSAGNYRDDDWKYISAPADALNIISVGALGSDSTISVFSSSGFINGRIKPELATKGVAVSALDASGQIKEASGTSFSAPNITGFIACLLEEYPNAKPSELRAAIIRSCHQYFSPDSLLGYGVPDFKKASEMLRLMLNDQNFSEYLKIYPNPFTNILNIQILNPKNDTIKIELYNITGSLVFSNSFVTSTFIDNLEIELGKNLPNGLYMLKIIRNNEVFMEKVICRH